jgi:hypothetical protein
MKKGRPKVDKKINLQARITDNTVSKKAVELIEKELSKGATKSQIVQEAVTLWAAFKEGRIITEGRRKEPDKSKEDKLDDKIIDDKIKKIDVKKEVEKPVKAKQPEEPKQKPKKHKVKTRADLDDLLG